ncbi:MAG: virulence RhuM family protein [Treponema sp.]|nr:virulence RhuM family protein [Treponema sp.]
MKKIFEDSEPGKEATIRKFLIVQNEGSRQVEREVDHYALQAIIAVGFKVKSARAVQFRKWVNKIAKDYTIQGWAMDVDRGYLKELETAAQTTRGRKAEPPEA